MKKIEKSVTELLNERNNMLAKREVINIRMNEIEDKAKAGKREFSAEENVEYQKLQADFTKLGREIAMNVDVVNYMNAKPNVQKSKNALLREAFQGDMWHSSIRICLLRSSHSCLFRLRISRSIRVRIISHFFILSP